MAKSLKINGIAEIKAIKRRAIRQCGYGRISETDKNYIVTRCNEIESRIVSMHENSPDLPKGPFE